MMDPAEELLAAVLKRAIHDAKADRSDKVRYEAAAWLWDVAPVVAERAGVEQIDRRNGLIA